MHRKDSPRAARRGWRMACALATALLSPAPFAHSLVAGFDEAVGHPLPVTLSSRDGDLVVRDRIRADVTYADGRTGQLFAVTWRGIEGVAVRETDGLRLVVRDGERIAFTHLDAATDEPGESSRVARFRPRHGLPIDPGAPPFPASPSARVKTLRNGGYTDLYVFTYVQDGIQDDDATLFGAYLADFVRQLSQEHFVGLNVHVRMRRDLPGITARMEPTDQSLQEWRRRFYANLPGDESPDGHDDNRLNLLLVNTTYAQLPNAMGVAENWGDFAIASIRDDARVPAHELGHLLLATHDRAETVEPATSGKPETCVTTMWPHPDHPDCGWFSPANIEEERVYEEARMRFSQ